MPRKARSAPKERDLMSAKKSTQELSKRETLAERTTVAATEFIEQENSQRLAKTARLRAARLTQERADKPAAAKTPKPPRKKTPAPAKTA